MKKLYLLRHAKSDWSNQGMKDFDRPLNDRGIRVAPKMGKKLDELRVKPHVIISSPAERARMTSQLVAEQLHYSVDDISFHEEIYEASVRILLRIINELDDDYQRVMLVGHNPGFTYLSEYLTGAEVNNIPTAGFVEIDFDFTSWKMVSQDTGSLKMFIYPKQFNF